MAKKLSTIVSSILHKRGFTSDSQKKSFLSWDENLISDLSSLKDIQKAAKRIIKAINNEEKIMIYGDYDADGATSLALAYNFFEYLGYDNVIIRQPSRFIEGYGLHNSIIDECIESGVSLLVTADCGIANVEEIEYANSLKLEVIVTDHHLPKEKIPEAYAVVNPNQKDDKCFYDLKHLAGVGVFYALSVTINDLLDNPVDSKKMRSLLVYFAIGTICDMAHLSLTNRILCRHGLKEMLNGEFPGIDIFLEDSDKSGKFVASEKLSFLIGPSINSKGRLGDPTTALDLIRSRSMFEVLELYSVVRDMNQERKEIQKEIFLQVDKIASQDDSNIMVIYGEGWHQGIVGIVASRVVDKYRKPCLILTNTDDEGIAKGSGRSFEGVHLLDLMDECSDLFIKYGGHKAAAGFSIKIDNIDDLSNRLNQAMEKLNDEDITKDHYYDVEVKLFDITKKMIEEISSLEPFGMGNPAPIFKITEFEVGELKLLKNEHLKMQLISGGKKIDALYFNYNDVEAIENASSIEIYGSLGINEFAGKITEQIVVDRIEIVNN